MSDDQPTNGTLAPRPKYTLPAAEPDFRNLVQALGYSGYFADMRSAAQAVVKIMAGKELHLGPVASMTNIFVVNGRIALSAGVLATLVKRSGKYDYRVRAMDNDGCTIAFFQRGAVGWEESGESTFTAADARTAGLLDKPGPWRQYRRNMLFNRALSNGVRWHCPDVAHGPVYLSDEIPAHNAAEGGPDTADEPRAPLRTPDEEPYAAYAGDPDEELDALDDAAEEETHART